MMTSSSDGTTNQSQHLQEGESLPSVKALDQQNTLTRWLPGLMLVMIVGAISFQLSVLHASLDALAISVIIGLFLSTLLRHAGWYKPGSRLAQRIFIPLGIVLYGAHLDLTQLTVLPVKVIVIGFGCMVSMLLVTRWLSHVWKVSKSTGWLVAGGSATSGTPAVAVISPIIEAEPEASAISTLVVTAIGLLGLLTLPLLRELLYLPNNVYAILSGISLYHPGFVQVATSNLAPEFSAIARSLLSVRILILMVVVLALMLFQNRATTVELKFGQNLWKAIKRNWFLFLFVLLAVLVSIPATSTFIMPLRPWAILSLSIAMASIGLSADIDLILSAGSRPLQVGLLGWFLTALFFLLVWPLFL